MDYLLGWCESDGIYSHCYGQKEAQKIASGMLLNTNGAYMRYRLSSVVACVNSQVAICAGHKQHIQAMSSNVRWFRS